MKHVFILIAAIVITATACKKGDTGPAGNADVTVYNYESKTFTGSTNYTITNISQGRIDSSLILAYYNPATEVATAWYPVPGIGSGSAYETRYFLYQTSTSPSTYTFAVRVLNPGTTAAYATAVTFKKFKIIIASAATVLPGGRQAAPVDYNDYNAVKKYYNLSE